MEATEEFDMHTVEHLAGQESLAWARVVSDHFFKRH